MQLLGSKDVKMVVVVVWKRRGSAEGMEAGLQVVILRQKLDERQLSG